jgi:hypothetical protein
VKGTAFGVALALVLCACGAHGRRQSAEARGVRLTNNVPMAVRATCAAAARVTRIPVVCPPLVPADGVTGDHDLYGVQIIGPDVYTMSFNDGQVPGYIHWEIGAGTLQGVATAEFDERDWDAPASKRPARLIGARRCSGGVPVMVYRFPQSDGQLEGHDVALATVGRLTYFASIHGYTHDDADVTMLLAILGSARRDHVTRVGPSLGTCRAVVAK